MREELKNDIKEIASKITKEEFFNKYVDCCCPSDFGMNSLIKKCKIENEDDIEKWCKPCWETVIKNEKFKFKAVKNKYVNSEPNTYTIADLLNDFPAETKFLSNDHLFRIQLGELQTYDEDIHEWRKSINSLKQMLDMKFTKVEEPKLKPMTFEGAVRTGNKIKYEYDNFTLDDFYTPQSIFRRLVSPMYSSKTVSDIILKGTWYAEGVYE